MDDACSEVKITPLLLLYHLRKNRKSDEMAALLYRGADPIFAEKSEPWGFFIDKREVESDDDEKKDGFYSKDIEKEKPGRVGEKGTNSLDRLESSEIKMVDAGTVYFCRFRDDSAKEKFPVELFGALKEKMNEDGVSRDPVNSIRVLDGTVMDIYAIMEDGR
jgi:hypothetical protein